MTTTRLRLAPHGLVPAATTAVGASAAVLGALAVTAGYGAQAVALAGVSISILVLPRLSRAAGLPRGYFSVEIPVALLLLSTLVFRIRDAETLADNPLDSAALYRLFLVGVAGLSAWFTFLRPRETSEQMRVPAPIFLYAVYVLVVFLGAPLSVNFQLTAYRAIELGVGLAVVLSAVQYAGANAVMRMERVLYWYVILSVLSVWIGVALFPHQAIANNIDSPIGFAVQGVYPTISSNGAGGLGAVLLLWSLGLRVSGRRSGKWNLALITLGAVTLLACQYRTGYAMVAVTLVVLLGCRGRKVLAGAALITALGLTIWSASSITAAAEPYVLRGQGVERARELSGRVEYWQRSLPVWRKSPILGNGLLTATRFEVLGPLGSTTTSTIHSTWVEALVGTGVVGLALIASFFVLMLRLALRDLMSPAGLVYPALLTIAITVSTLTGSTIAIFGYSSLLMLVLAFALGIRVREAV